MRDYFIKVERRDKIKSYPSLPTFPFSLEAVGFGSKRRGKMELVIGYVATSPAGICTSVLYSFMNVRAA